MKRILLFFILVFSMIVVSGCTNDQTKREMSLVKIEVFNDNGIEIEGSWEYRYGYEPMAVQPVYYDYFVPAELNESYTVKLYFFSNTGSTLTKFYITYNEDTSYADEFIPTYDGEYWVSTIEVESLSESKTRWGMFSWYEDDVRNNFTVIDQKSGLQFDVESSSNLVNKY